MRVCKVVCFGSIKSERLVLGPKKGWVWDVCKKVGGFFLSTGLQWFDLGYIDLM